MANHLQSLLNRAGFLHYINTCMKEITYHNRIYTAQDIVNMRRWLSLYAYCYHPVEFVDNLSSFQVLNAVNDYYYNGVEQFNADYYTYLLAPFMQSNLVISVTVLNGCVKVYYPLSECAFIVKPDVWERYQQSLQHRNVLVHVD